jgi:NADH-quinone oxidoreductase subunit M
MGLLSLAIWTPIAVGAVLLALGRDQHVQPVRWLALIGALAAFLVTLPLYGGFEIGSAAMQHVEKVLWVPAFNIHYHLGVDGISLWLVLLTAFITVIVVVASWTIEERVNQYMGAFLILSGLMIGVFSAQDAMLFYVFFEATLIPMYLIIGIWGGPNKIYAAFKFFLYTLLGSLLMLVALIYLYNQSGGSFDLATWYKLPLGSTAQTLLFFAFFAAFAVKVPMWPVHTWLPDVHVEAPTGGSAVLAAIMLKLGAYGFLRFSLPILPDASQEWAWLMITLSLVAVVYVGLVAMVQQDMKKLVAYSSVAHMGFVTLGFFLFSDLGVSGGIVQMIAHGFVSAAMFLSIGVLYDRVHSREIADYGGVINTMPKFAAFALLFTMANSGLPGTAGFVGEWMVILAAVKANFWVGLAAASALIFGAAYSLWMFKRVYLGEPANDNVKALTDINGREFLVMSVLAVAVLFMGVYPKPFTDVMDASVIELLRHVAISKLP